MSLAQLAERLTAALKGQFISELRRLVSQPSISTTGEGIGDCARLVVELLEQRGLRTFIVEGAGHPVVIGHTASPDPELSTMLFYNHYDTEPVEPERDWTYPPFAGRVMDGVMYGRGVVDNKGSFTARLHALDLLRDLGGSLPCNVTFLVDGEEEIGSPSLPAVVKQYSDILKADGCLWEQGVRDAADRPILTLGAGRINLFIELIVRGANREVHGNMASLVPNPVMKLMSIISSIADVEGKVVLEGFYEDVEEPLRADLDACSALAFPEAELKAILGLESFAGGVTGPAAVERHFFLPTCGVSGFVGGYTGHGKKAVVPREARAKLDIRLVPFQRADRILALIRDHVKSVFPDVEIIALDCRPGPARRARTDVGEPLVRAAVLAANEVYGMEPAVYPYYNEVGPRAYIREDLGIPTVGIGVGWYGSRQHAPDENLRLKDYWANILHVGRILQCWNARS